MNIACAAGLSMRRMRDPPVLASAILAMLLGTGLAGCIFAPVHHPDDPPLPWSGTDAPVWVVRTTGCGMCYEAPHATATALHTDGTVVVFQYTGNRSYHDPSGGDPEAEPHKTTDPTGTVRTYASHADHLEAFVPAARVLAESDVWWASSLPLHVEGHWVGRLGPDDMEQVRRGLERALAKADDPGIRASTAKTAAGSMSRSAARTPGTSGCTTPRCQAMATWARATRGTTSRTRCGSSTTGWCAPGPEPPRPKWGKTPSSSAIHRS